MEQTLEIFNRLVGELLADEAKNPMAEHIPSALLYEHLDLKLQKEGISSAELEKSLKELVFATPRTATNAFFNQLFGGRQDKAILGDLLSVILNNSMYTYKAAGPQIGVEKTIVREMCKMVGWGDASDGTLAPGGSMTNFMGMVMARDAFSEKIRYEGMQQKLTVYTSADSHYSIPKNAAFSGIGRKNVRAIETDDKGRMDMADLRKAIRDDIEAGCQPVLINCTAGTTVLGSYDNLVEAGEIAKEFDIWLHVDGAYGGAVLFSDKYRHLIEGIEGVDSFSVNAHKMLGTPLSCSLILVKDKKHLYDSFSNDASYLYQTDHDEFNLGKKSIQCGRRNDALKFWVLWKSVGTNGLAQIVDKQFELAEAAKHYIGENPDYVDYSVDDTVSVCFNYKGIPAEDICTLLYEKSELSVGYGSSDGNTFIRLVTINANNEKEDILNFFKTIEAFVEKHSLAPKQAVNY
ncbi:pyridoxal phosphate-dependent decarboxylase family protein [Kordiimonas laminariae]|uniref:pyridoxal phosphate-dependent decarboxylase family protein n=1 Tax=Kordiimonas laminariae TaxID=2917717 RepID=UPI001FF51D1D|nr:aminotransferase class V-fold PLP-dependent enzyme [Kordiimonas laminariae]MCK0069659.1 aminotransferase class V-fold PLP-dependent enzyme [Kordiimonas laminariae]